MDSGLCLASLRSIFSGLGRVDMPGVQKGNSAIADKIDRGDEMIIWNGLNGINAQTNNVPFDYIVAAESRARGDKTWQRLRGWAGEFALVCSTRIENYIVDAEFVARHVHDSASVVEKAKYFGHALVSDIYVFDALVERGFVCIHKYAGSLGTITDHSAIDRTGWSHTLGAGFEIRDSGGIIYTHPGIDAFSRDGYGDYYDDWKIIAELSGKKAQRRARIEVAVEHGHMSGVIFTSLMPPPQVATIVPLMRSAFNKTERGNFVTRSVTSKVLFSNTDTSGYYSIKEYDTHLKATMLEEYQTTSSN